MTMPSHLDSLARVPEWREVTRDVWETTIFPARQPAVLKGLVNDWPVVGRARQSAASVAEYLGGFYSNELVATVVTPPEAKGRMFYGGDLKNFNFTKSQEQLGSVLNALLKPAEPAQGIAMQAVPARRVLPGFEAENALSMLPGVEPRLWIGNAVTVAPHYDLSDNLACAAAGRRRFILFPPEQLPNLYVGPIDVTPAGAPISLVSLTEPDFDRYPRYAEALAAAQVAELEPGDAIYIPYMWWHGVQSLDSFNLLVNYWWNSTHEHTTVHPSLAIMLSWLSFHHLPPEQRGLWRMMFDHYVFPEAEHPLAHVAPGERGVLDDLDEVKTRQLKQMLAQLIARY